MNLHTIFYPTVLLFLFIYPLSLFSQTTAESLSLGGTLPTESYTTFSPSLYFSDQSYVKLHHRNDYFLKELQSISAEIPLFFHAIRMGVGASTFGYKHYRETTISASTVKQLSNHWTLGCSFHFNLLHYTGIIRNRGSFKLSLDNHWQINSSTALYSKALHTFIAELQDTTIQYIKDDFSFGTSFRFSPSTIWMAEVNLKNMTQVSFRTGFKYDIEKISLNIGVRGTPILPSYGIGYGSDHWKCTISSSWLPTLGHSFACDICIILKNKNR